MAENANTVDYEAEYNRLIELNQHLRDVNFALQSKADKLEYVEAENARMRAQLDIVYLIFGKRG